MGLHSSRDERKRRHRLCRLAIAGLLLLIVWAGSAYFLLPFVLRQYEEERGEARPEMVTRTGIDLPGDPINIGVVASREQLLSLMTAAGWFRANPITLKSSIGIVDSVLFDRRDPHAPVSPLYFLGRQEDLAFEKPVGTSADRRQHVRFWCLPQRDGAPLWLGSASFDSGVGISHYTFALTHAIDPHVDRARDTLTANLAATGRIARSYEIPGIGPTLHGRNGEGDRYVTDGEIRISVMNEPKAGSGCAHPATLP